MTHVMLPFIETYGDVLAVTDTSDKVNISIRAKSKIMELNVGKFETVV